MIPKKFTIASKTYKVNIVETDDVEGNASYGSLSTTERILNVATTVHAADISPEEQHLTFNHELVHAILHGMGETELFNDERFVEGFAQLLTQYELTRKY